MKKILFATVRPTLALLLMIAPSPAHRAVASEVPEARPVDEFLDSLGVNTHTGWRDPSYAAPNGTPDVAKVEAMLAYLGVSRIRDYIGTPAMLEVFRRLGEDGVRLNMFVTQEKDAGSLEEQVKRLAELKPYLAGIESPNEPDLEGAAFDKSSGPSATRALQSRLDALVHAIPELGGVPVVETSVGHLENYPDYFGMANADRGNMHSYFFRFDRPIRDEIPLRLALARAVAPGRPLVTTETGWPTVGKPGGYVDEATQAVLLLDVLFDEFKAGVSQTFVYQLIDEPASDDHYGLFVESGAPKAAAVALHNLTRILADAGRTQASDPWPIAIEGLPETGNALRLQKSDHAFSLALWNEPPVWDVGRNVALAAADVPITVTTHEFRRACLYDPLRAATSETLESKDGSFDLSLPAHLIIVGFPARSNEPCPEAGADRRMKD